MGLQAQCLYSYFSPYVFLRTLLPLLKRTAQQPNSDVRIVMVRPPRAHHVCLGELTWIQLTSEGHRMPPKDCHFRSIDDFNREFKGESLASSRRYSAYIILVLPIHLSWLSQRPLEIHGCFAREGVAETAGCRRCPHHRHCRTPRCRKYG